MNTFDHFDNSHGDVCPICKTDADGETLLIPIPGTESGGVCEAQQIHRKCSDFVLFAAEMQRLSHKG